jgi:hypothetical protein
MASPRARCLGIAAISTAVQPTAASDRRAVAWGVVRENHDVKPICRIPEHHHWTVVIAFLTQSNGRFSSRRLQSRKAPRENDGGVFWGVLGELDLNKSIEATRGFVLDGMPEVRLASMILQ